MAEEIILTKNGPKELQIIMFTEKKVVLRMAECRIAALYCVWQNVVKPTHTPLA